MNWDDVFQLQNASWPVLMVDSKGKIIRANQRALEVFGGKINAEQQSDLSAVWEASNVQSVEQFLGAGRSGTAGMIPVRLLSGNGSGPSWLACICAASGDNAGFLIQLFTDHQAATSESKRLAEAGQAHKQKLDCALQLARTVSHEFNNALTSVVGHTSWMLGKTEADHPWRRSLLEVEKSAARAAEISNDLASFSRQEKETQAEPRGNVNAVLQRCVEFFKRNAGTEALIWSVQLERNLFACRFDELKMQQAFLRVIENSVQAFRDSGRIVIQSRNVELNASTQDRNVKLVAGVYVCVEISDNGCGIELDVLPRIFEPFFTTKRDKKHRGLGLAWVYGIVTNLGGGVAVSSQVGQGTSVRIYLPAEKRILHETPQFSAEELKGSETVLLVDDEELVLTMAQTILAENGYKVEIAGSGKQALGIISAKQHPFDLVVTDLVMPAMGGRELVEKIHVLSPNSRVICTSGYPWPETPITNLPFLKKPFSAQELLSKIKHALQES
jgi:two-component system cell cycle sensor histidine kinase/response regulator CckA